MYLIQIFILYIYLNTHIKNLNDYYDLFMVNYLR